ncbi:MAG: magnesium transporter [Oscillospiraceae bacterium]|nr:magnesium transporter [Oscillospiraceae bacterium]
MDNEKLNKTQDIIDTPAETLIDDAEIIKEEEEKEVFVLADTLPELDEEEAAEDSTDNSSTEDEAEEDVELIDIITADDEEIEEQEYDLKEALLTSDQDELVDVIESAYAIDVDIALEEFTDDEIISFAERIDAEHMAQIYEQMDEDLQFRIAELFGVDNMLKMFKFMSKDDIADILGDLPINMRKRILRMMKRKDIMEIEHLLLYEDDTAGGLMTTEYIALNGKWTVEKALNKIKEIAPKTEVIETIFVLNGRKELIGTADLRDILVEDNNTTLEEIMYDNIVSVPAEMDQEEVSHIVSKYDLKVVPVVNRKNSLLGIITVDDIIDVLFEEQTEDILKMAGVGTDEDVDNSVIKSVKMRLPWLMVNLVTAFVSSTVISVFEGTIAQVTALAAAMPIVAALGGNTGNQTLSLVIRNITLGELNLKDDWKLVTKEIALALCNGAIMGFIAGLVLAMRYGSIYLGIIMLVAMIANLTIAGISGFFIPLILKALNVDPALASSIFLTATTDICGYLVFLGLAKMFLPLLL